MMQTEPTIFIVDDEETTCRDLNLLFRSVGMRVRIFQGAREFLNEVDSSVWGCLVTEVRLADIGGLELQELLQSEGITIPVIFLSGYGDVPMAVRAMKTGALDFFVKPFNGQILLERIQQGLRQEALNRSRRAEQEELVRRYAMLTDREQQVMECIVMGKANKVIARELGLSAKTVEFHRSHVMEKMKAESLAQLVKIDFNLESFRESPRWDRGKPSWRMGVGRPMEETCNRT